MKDFNKYSRISHSTVFKFFDNWPNALEEAGYRIEEDMIKNLKEIKSLNKEKYFSYKFYKKNGGRYNLKILKKHLRCPDWKTLLEKYLLLRKIRIIRIVKSQGKRKSLFTEEQLFSELNRVWQQLGRRPTYSEFRKFGNIGTKVYERKFGSWIKAIEAISLKFGYFNQSNEKTWVTDELLLAELKEIASKTSSQIITFDDYKKLGGIHSRITFGNHFGGWAKTVKKIGKKAGVEKGVYSNEDLFAELQRVWEILGRQPRFREMIELSKINAHLYNQTFGSWIKAVYAFCLDRENNSEENNIVNGKEILEQKKATNENSEASPEKIDSTEVITMHTGRTPSLRLRFNVLKRDNFKCLKCGRSPSTHPGLVLEIDHKNPYSKGGETILENLETLCLDCNRGKSNVF